MLRATLKRHRDEIVFSNRTLTGRTTSEVGEQHRIAVWTHRAVGDQREQGFCFSTGHGGETHGLQISFKNIGEPFAQRGAAFAQTDFDRLPVDAETFGDLNVIESVLNA